MGCQVQSPISHCTNWFNLNALMVCYTIGSFQIFIIKKKMKGRSQEKVFHICILHMLYVGMFKCIIIGAIYPSLEGHSIPLVNKLSMFIQ